MRAGMRQKRVLRQSLRQWTQRRRRRNRCSSFMIHWSKQRSIQKMASKLTTCFVCWNLTTGFNCNNHHNRAMRSPFPPSSKLPHRSTIIIRYLSLSLSLSLNIGLLLLLINFNFVCSVQFSTEKTIQQENITPFYRWFSADSNCSATG
jgi:hypothetical protein